jgi:hypothetical protein
MQSLSGSHLSRKLAILIACVIFLNPSRQILLGNALRKNWITLLPTYTFKAWTGKALTFSRITVSGFLYSPLSQKKQLIGIVKDLCSIVTSAMLIIMVNKMAALSQLKFVRMPLFWRVRCLKLVMLATGVRVMMIYPMLILGNCFMNFSDIFVDLVEEANFLAANLRGAEVHKS